MCAALASIKMKLMENFPNAKIVRVVTLFQIQALMEKNIKFEVIALDVLRVKLVIQAHNFAMHVQLDDDRL